LRPTHQPGGAGAWDVADHQRLGIAHGLQQDQAKGLSTFQGGQADQVATGQEGSDLRLRAIAGQANAVTKIQRLDKAFQARPVLTTTDDEGLDAGEAGAGADQDLVALVIGETADGQDPQGRLTPERLRLGQTCSIRFDETARVQPQGDSDTAFPPRLQGLAGIQIRRRGGDDGPATVQQTLARKGDRAYRPGPGDGRWPRPLRRRASG
jgi:hypothetical protein